MNRKAKMAAGIIGGAALGIILRSLSRRKPKITKRGRQLAHEIDERIKEDKVILMETKQLLEEQLEKVNASLERLNNDTCQE